MDRRSFIRFASFAGAGHVAGLHALGAGNGQPGGSIGYKALVGIFLFGGNDSNNMLVPLNTAANGANGYTSYAAIRGPLALPEVALLPLDAQVEGNYGLHPSLPDIQDLFNSGKAAFLANVGTLPQPLTQAQFLSGAPFPGGLFEPIHQQLEWQNATQNDTVKTGWAGRIADRLDSVYNPSGIIPMITSVAGDTLFCDGATTSPLVLDPSNLPTGAVVNKYRPSKPLQTQFPANNALAAQLKVIAEIIQVRQALGMERQIFFAALNGFDTHSEQGGTQAELLGLLSQALTAFYEATEEMGVADEVTSFTMSEYSRSFEPNASGGSNHGWGGHHIIAGGAVDGGKIYGAYPRLVLGGPNDCGSTGQWIPTTSVSQYGATLASWFGLPASGLATIFPQIGNFETQNLGFLG